MNLLFEDFGHFLKRHSIKATRTLIFQNQAHEITANLRPNPTFGADSQFVPFFSPQDFSGENLNETQQFDIGIGYLFERGHKRQRRLQAARDQTAVTRAQVTDAERTLVFNVGQQCISILLAESTLQFALQDLKSFQEHPLGHFRHNLESFRGRSGCTRRFVLGRFSMDFDASFHFRSLRNPLQP